MKRFWVSWYSHVECEECQEPPFEAWITGETFCFDDADTEFTYCADIGAETEDEVWEAIAKYYPDYRQRFISETDSDWIPSDRFQGHEGVYILGDKH